MGAVSRKPSKAISAISKAPDMYQAGIKGDPVKVIRPATATWVVPPKTEIASE